MPHGEESNDFDVNFANLQAKASLALMDCPSSARDNAIVSLLWAEQINDEDDQVDDARRYQSVRALIADALALGCSLRACKAKRILMISSNVRHICGSELLSLFWELREVEPLMAPRAWSGEARSRNTFTKLRAMEWVEFRKILIMDLGMIVKKVKDVDSLFGFQTPAAVYSHELCAISSGLMLLMPSKAIFAFMERELLDGGERPCGSLQDYLSQFYPAWEEIPFEYNFDLNQLHSRRFPRFEDIKVINHSGPQSPREWLFKDSGYSRFDLWTEGHLLPSYGKVDIRHLRTLRCCIDHWQSTWGMLQGLILTYNREVEAAGGRGRPVLCTPWMFDDMPIPAQEVKCEDCSRWPLPLRKIDQNENTCAQIARSRQSCRRERRKKSRIRGRSNHRKSDSRGRSSRQQHHPRGRSRTPQFGRSPTPLEWLARSLKPLGKRRQHPIGARV